MAFASYLIVFATWIASCCFVFGSWYVKRPHQGVFDCMENIENFEGRRNPELRVVEENKVPINSHIWTASTTFKQLYNLLKKLETIEIHFDDHLGLTWSFKTMNRPDPIRPDPTWPGLTWPDPMQPGTTHPRLTRPTVTLFDGFFIKKYKR